MAATKDEGRSMAWSDVERVVAAVVERKQRLRELEARREGLRSSLARAIEERSEQASEWELQQEEQARRQHLLSAVRSQEEDLESMKQHAASLRTGLKGRQSQLHKAKVQLKEAGHRLQEADQILEAHGKRLGEKLKSEVRGQQLRAISDLTVVFPIWDLAPHASLAPRPRVRSLEALPEAGLEAGSRPQASSQGTESRPQALSQGTESKPKARPGPTRVEPHPHPPTGTEQHRSSTEPGSPGSETDGSRGSKAVQRGGRECESEAAERVEASLKADSGSGEDARRSESSQESSRAHRTDESNASSLLPGSSSVREGYAGGAEEAVSLRDLGCEAVNSGCVEHEHSQCSGQQEERHGGTRMQDEVNRATRKEQQEEATDGSSRVAGSMGSLERGKGGGHTQNGTTKQPFTGGEKSNGDGRESSANTQNGSAGEKRSGVQDVVPSVNKGSKFEGTYLICGIPLLSAHRLRHAGLLDEAQRQQQAAALGMCAQVVSLVAFYSSLTLRYPVQWRGSTSSILDPCPPVTAQQATASPHAQDITLPLFPESVKNFSRCTFAMVLLAKDVEQILSFFGLQWSGDRHAILENLSFLMKGEIPPQSLLDAKHAQNVSGSIKRHISCPSFKDSV